MTDNEIIKALEHCKDCSANLNVEIIDLINRQQAEIEKLNVDLVGMRGAFNYYKKHYDKAKSEIKRLRNENEILSKNADTAFQGVVREALDIINHQQKKNDDLLYKLTGVMHSVDKWLDGVELEQDEVNRAATMREKTLRLIETAKAEAIKEFAERLKNIYIKDKRYDRPNAHTLIDWLFANIDNLVKEMVGDTE